MWISFDGVFGICCGSRDLLVCDWPGSVCFGLGLSIDSCVFDRCAVSGLSVGRGGGKGEMDMLVTDAE